MCPGGLASNNAPDFVQGFPLRLIRFLIGGLAAVLVILWAGFMLLRDIPAGAYQPDIPQAEGGDDLVEVSRFLPVMTFHRGKDDHVLRAVFIPVLQKLLPLGMEGKATSYTVSDGGQVLLNRLGLGADTAVAMVPISPKAQAEWLKNAEATRQDATAQYQRIADATLTPTWSAPILGGRLGLHLSDDLMLVVDQSDPGQGAAIRAADRPLGYEYALSFLRSDRVADEITAFRDRFEGAQEFGKNRWLVRADDGDFNLIAGISDGNGDIALARGQAEDEDEAARFMAALNGLTLGEVPYALAAGDYIGPASPTPDELRQAITGALWPAAMLRSDTASREYTTDASAEAMPWMQVVVRLGFLPEGARFPESDFAVLGEQPDIGLRVEADSTVPRCFPQLYYPIGPTQPEGQLVMALQSYGASLPQCRDLAGIFAGLDLASMPEMQISQKLAGHFGKYPDVRMEDDTIIASGPGQSVRFDLAGDALLTVSAEFLSSNLGGYVIRDGGQQGLIDENGQTILPTEYDDISFFDQIDPQTTLISAGKDGRHGLYVPERGAFLLPLEYDSFKMVGFDSLIVAAQGDRFAAYDVAGDRMLPGLFDEYIIGQPGRAAASDSDFVALRQDDGAWIFWTRTPQHLLEGRFRDLTVETGVTRSVFHLTRQDGTRFSITSDLELLPVE